MVTAMVVVVEVEAWLAAADDLEEVSQQMAAASRRDAVEVDLGEVVVLAKDHQLTNQRTKRKRPPLTQNPAPIRSRPVPVKVRLTTRTVE